MEFKEKSITLKNGKTAVLRAPRKEDAAEVLEFLRTACDETEYLASYPEEISYTPDSEEKYLQNTLDSPNNMMIVCVVDGRIAGNCEIVFFSSAKTKHRGAVMIGLLKEFWGMGIGSALFSELISAAKERGLKQLELEVIEGNTRAIALYEKMGFSVMAVHPDAFVLKDGSTRGAVFMRKVL